jgi:membrane carboxypeptidase/penicillin-binding protein
LTFIEALISTEDRNFYHHHGISIRGTARALVSNITVEGRSLQSEVALVAQHPLKKVLYFELQQLGHLQN